MAERSSQGSRGPRRSSGGERHGFSRGQSGESRRGQLWSYRGGSRSHGQGGGHRRDDEDGRRSYRGDGERSYGGDRGRSYGDGQRGGSGSRGQGGFSRGGGDRGRSFDGGRGRSHGEREERGGFGLRGQGGYRRDGEDRGRSYRGDGDRSYSGERGRSYGDGERDGRRGDSRGQGGVSRGGGRGGRRFEDRGGRSDDQRRDSRPPQRHRVSEPPLPEDVQADDLDMSARRELRGLARANAENISRHLVMVQRLLASDPELAFQHARYAASHAGRVAVVREAAGVAAYLSGHYQDALRDIRAARRLSGLDLHHAIEADCERALGHLGRALKAAEGADPRQLDDVEEAEIAMVVSGVRHEMGQTELGLIVIEEAIMMFRGDRETLRRLHSVRADRLEELGRVEEAQAVRERIGEAPDETELDDVEVYDVEEELDEERAAAEAEASASDEDAPEPDEAETQSGAEVHEGGAESDGDDATHADGQDRPADGGSGSDGEAHDGDDATDIDSAAGADTDADASDGESDADWSLSFAERVEAEMAELLGETEDLAGAAESVVPAETTESAKEQGVETAKEAQTDEEEPTQASFGEEEQV